MRMIHRLLTKGSDRGTVTWLPGRQAHDAAPPEVPRGPFFTADFPAPFGDGPMAPPTPPKGAEVLAVPRDDVPQWPVEAAGARAATAPPAPAGGSFAPTFAPIAAGVSSAVHATARAMGEQLAPMTTVPAALVGTDPPVPAFAPTTATMASATPSATLAVDALHATARRDADLADRVRAVIDDLKTQITAPQAVADLFALDRAVTQLRRGASLSAVIAQRDVPSGAPASMRLADAVRMASAEASNAPSVAIDLRADPTVDGATGEQLAHVLGELFDHESLFGDRDHPIEVSGSPDGDAFTMAIRQWGPALSADDLASINTYLGGAIPSGPDVEPSTLGLYVAGQLAARAGIHLTASAARDRTAGHTGTLVQVHIPADLVAGCEAAATPPPAVPKPFTPVNGGYAPVFASGPQTLALAMPDASPAHATGAVPTVGTLVFDANALSYEPNPLSFEPEIVSFAPPVGRPAPEQPPVESAWLPAFGAFAEPGDHTPDIRGEALAELSNLAGRSAGAARPRPSAGKPATHAGRVDRDAEDLRRLLTTLTSTTSTTDPAGSEQ